MLRISRDSRSRSLVSTGTETTVSPFLPAWMMVSRVYVYVENTVSRRAASRDSARKPRVAAATGRALQCPCQAGGEGGRQAAVARQGDHMIDPQLARQFCSAIGAAV